MVSPRLLLTNHHVLREAATATGSRAEFNYQDTLNDQSAPEQDELGGWVNEGVRISSLVAFLRGQQHPAEQQEFIVELLRDSLEVAQAPIQEAVPVVTAVGGAPWSGRERPGQRRTW